MCGICGTVHFSERPVAREALEEACAALRHRGPDHTGTWVDADRGSTVGMGAVRLAVLDPSPAGHQPMHDSSGRFHLAFNGEIYNYRTLRQELAEVGHHFASDGDTEVVLAACARWGTEALLRFNGMWALAFYDSETRAGFLSRDRFGIKPLFFRAHNGGLSFASELQAIIALAEGGLGLDSDAVVQHLQFGYIAHPSTIYREVRRLSPGHYLKFDASGTRSPVKYFDPVSDRRTRAIGDYRDTLVTLRRRLADAVVYRRVSDVPIGAFLSGGLDSSIIVRHLSEAVGRPIQTFAVGYAGQRAYDETKYARLVASRFGTDHHEFVLTEQQVLNAIPLVLDHLGEPVGDSSIIPTSLVSGFARQFVTVALSGDGGDELFGGYWRYLGHRSVELYNRVPAVIRLLLLEPLLRTFGSAKSSLLANRMRQFRKLLRSREPGHLARHVAWSRILAPEAEGLFGDHAQAAGCDRHTLELARALTAGLDDPDWLNGILAFDLQYQLPADMLHKVDLAGMMHSLEVRVPFLDPAVVSLALASPADFKIYRGLRKRVLTDAYRGRLPDAVLDRPKQGFEVPIGEFLRGPLREMFHDTVTRRVVESFGLLSYDAVTRLYAEHRDRRAEHADVLFAILSLCWWYDRNQSVLTRS